MRAAFVDDSVYLCMSAKMLGHEIRRRVDQQLLIPRVVHSPRHIALWGAMAAAVAIDAAAAHVPDAAPLLPVVPGGLADAAHPEVVRGHSLCVGTCALCLSARSGVYVFGFYVMARDTRKNT